MRIYNNLKHISIILVIFSLPFLDFLKNNIDEADIILGESFFFLIFILFFILLIFSLIVNSILKKKNFYKIFLIVVLSYWILFKHNFLKIIIKSFFDKFEPTISEFSSEISLFLIILLSSCVLIVINKDNQFFKKFIFIFFFLSLFASIFEIIRFNIKSNIIKNNEVKYINYPDN